MTYPVLERIVQHKETNLFSYIHNSIVQLCDHLGIKTAIRTSSEILIDHELTGQDRVLALCKATGADTYINAIGGIKLYSNREFRTQGIDLKFIRTRPFEYAQFGESFVPWLSIVDLLMFNNLEVVRECISTNYELI